MSTSQEVYEAVEAMLAANLDRTLTKQDAFKEVADERGVKPSNVAGNYYRHAKKIGAPLEARKRRARSGPKAKPQANPALVDGDLLTVDDAIGDLTTAVRRLTNAITYERASAARQAELMQIIRETLGA